MSKGMWLYVTTREVFAFDPANAVRSCYWSIFDEFTLKYLCAPGKKSTLKILV